MDKAILAERLQHFPQGQCMVVGDIAIDEMIYGVTSRMSREAPVLILHHQKTDILLGGGGNAANNLASLGADKVTMVGVAGKDYYCSLLFEAMERDGVSSEGMVQDETRPTITKTRVSGQAKQSVRQQIVRIDRESKEPVSPAIESALIERIEALAPQHKAIIISDYDLGVVTPRVIETCKQVAQAHHLKLMVDSHRRLDMFEGATIATPNQPEAEENLGYALDDPEILNRGIHQLKHQAGLENLLITRGSHGMSLIEADDRIYHVPVFNRSEVFDVTGAGDTVVATLTLAMATGASPLEAAVLGNVAASLVVKKYGTATTTTQEIGELIKKLDASLFQFDVNRSTV